MLYVDCSPLEKGKHRKGGKKKGREFEVQEGQSKKLIYMAVMAQKRTY